MTFTLWIWILCHVTRNPMTYIIRGETIELNAGELVFGRNRLAQQTGLTSQNVRTCLKNLKNWKNITIRSTNRFSILKVVNWETYQETENEINQQISQQPNQELTSNQPTAQPQNKNIKNIKNIKNNISAKRRHKIPPDFSLTDNLLQIANNHGLNGDRIKTVFEHFKAHHESRGTAMLNWDKAWLTWVINDRKFNPQSKSDSERDAWMKRHGLDPS